MASKLDTELDLGSELIFAIPGDKKQARSLRRLRDAGQLRQLATGMYTGNLKSAAQDIAQRNWSRVVSNFAPGAVLSHRSAFDNRPEGQQVFITRTAGQRRFDVPGLTLAAVIYPEGAPVLDAVHPLARDIPYQAFFVASQARAFLENLVADKRLAARMLPRTDVEARLERVMLLRGERGLNELRDAAAELSVRLKMTAEFKLLDGLVGALLGTHAVNKLTSVQARSRAQGRPYDSARLQLFEALAGELRGFPFADVAEPALEGRARGVFAFAESYFSNYIEGTTFTVEEAEDIVFNGKIIPLRTQDSHDVKGTFDAALRDPFYSQPPQNADEFLNWIQSVNAAVMQGRSEIQPGQWKEKSNQAGTTLFVLPELVPGTLRAAWPLFATLHHPMQRALLSMFVVAEVHPFTDGNGRTSRLLMNSFLSAQAQCRIIVPTVFREDYLLSLKALTHQADATAYIRAMRLCQAWTALLNFDGSVAELNQQLLRANAKQEDPAQSRLLSPVTGLAMTVDG